MKILKNLCISLRHAYLRGNDDLWGASLFILVMLWALTATGCDSGQAAFEKLKEQVSGVEHTDADHDEANHVEAEHSGEAHEDEGVLKLSEEEAAAAGIKVTTLQLLASAEQISVTGNIRANQDRLAHVQTRVPGRIVAVSAKLGDQVTEGQILATLDSVDLNEAGTDYRQNQSELSLAEANFRRAENLYKDKIIPQKDYLSARAELEKARAAQRAAVGKLGLFGVDPEQLRDSSANLVFPLVSPFAGTVIEKHVVLGEFAEPGDSLFTVADLSTLWIEAAIFEKDLSKIAAGMSANITVAAYPQETFQGRVTYIGSMVDEKSRTVSARVEVPNTGQRLKVGMFANVIIESGVGAAALSVPDNAVVLIKGQATVFVAEHGGFEPRPVQTGARAGGQVVIESGVAAGEAVVVSGAYNLKSRMLKSELGEGHAH